MESTSFYSDTEIRELGFAKCGVNVLISRKASIYGSINITIGDNVRIDDFCILSGKIDIGNYVHIAAYTALYGSNDGIIIGNYSNISSRICIYAISDDYSGDSMTNPLIPDKYKKVQHGSVYIGEHVIVGTNTTILPGVRVEQGVAIGAMSLVKKDLNQWAIYAGIPCKKISERSRGILSIVKEFEAQS